MAENSRASYGRKKSSPVIDNTYGHLQPQAIDLEKVVLGALMIDKDAFSIVSEMLVPETFYEPRHQKIYNAVRVLNMNENPVDIMTVTEELAREGTLDEVGGSPYIIELSSLRRLILNIMPRYYSRNIWHDSLSRFQAK